MSDFDNNTERTIVDGALAGGGDMGARMRALDWSKTPVGPVSAWPQSLKTIVRVALGAQYPMFVWWGRDAMTMFHNDAYVPILADKHPEALGRSAPEVWGEIWSVVGPLAEAVFTEGKPVFRRELQLFLQRRGYCEETYFTFSYSPIPDDDGHIGGMFCACFEDTVNVFSKRRLLSLRELAAATAAEAHEAGMLAQAATVLARSPADLPFALLYLVEGDGERAVLAETIGVPRDTAAAPRLVPLTDPRAADPWGFQQVVRTRRALTLDGLEARCGMALPGGAWPESARKAVVLPIEQTAQAGLAGFLIAGVSPRRDLDEDYQTYFAMIAGQLGAALTITRVYAATEAANVRVTDVLESMGDAFFAMDRDWVIVQVNARHETLTGLGRADQIGKNLLDLYFPTPESRQTNFCREYGRAMRDRVAVSFEEFYEPLSLWLAVNAYPQRNGGLAVFFRDISASKHSALEKERLVHGLQEADRRKDEFLGILSHELRSPLNVIGGHAQLLRIERPGTEDFAESLAAIERNVEIQTGLIDDLLDVSRIITGKLGVAATKFALEPVVTAALASVRFAAVAKDIQLERHVDGALGDFAGDAGRIQQILWNLLANAVKFTPRGGRVTLVALRRDAQIEFRVEDTGVGIGAEFLPYAFDRFHQEDTSNTRRYGGLGLGLAIVRHLAELHGGSVRVESPGRGQGATFIVQLPVGAAADENAAPRGASPRAKTAADPGDGHRILAGMRVLVVDDQDDARDLLRKALNHLGATVVTMSSARDALVALESSRPDLVVSDVGMPDMNGLEFMRHWRVRERQLRQRPLPALALTAYATTRDRDEALAAGYHVHLAKPLRIAELTRVLASLPRNVGF